MNSQKEGRCSPGHIYPWRTERGVKKILAGELLLWPPGPAAADLAGTEGIVEGLALALALLPYHPNNLAYYLSCGSSCLSGICVACMAASAVGANPASLTPLVVGKGHMTGVKPDSGQGGNLLASQEQIGCTGALILEHYLGKL